MKKFSLSLSRLKVLSALASVAFIFSACSSDEESAGANISPKDAVVNYASNGNASMIMSMRLGDLIDKSGLMKDLLPAEMKMVADGYLSQFLDSEENGLDLDETSFVLTDLTGLPSAPAMVGVVVAVSDAGTFASFVEGQTRMQPEEGEGFKFISLGGSGVIAGNSGFAAFFSGADFTGGKASGSLEKIMKSLSEKGKGDTKAISKFAEKKADFGFFMDFENYMEVIPKDEPGTAIMNSEFYKTMMKDAYMSGFVNFEAGKIVAEYDMAGNKKLMDLMTKAYNNGNADYANYLGGENLIGFVTANMNVDALLDSYEEMGFFDIPEVAKVLDAVKMATGLSVRDIANKFSGEFSLSFVGINVSGEDEAAEPENEYSGYYEARKNTEPVFTMAIGIRDSLFGKIFDTIPALVKKANYYAMSKGGLCLKNGVLFVSSDMMLLEDFALDGRLSTYTKNNAQKAIGSNPVYGYFSFDALTMVMAEINPEVALAVSQLDYAEMTATKNAQFKAVLYFKDKKTNALKSLGKLIMDAANKSGMMF